MSPSKARAAGATLILILISAACSADIWWSVPQLCGGKAYSATAKASGWEFDQVQRVSWATDDSQPLTASVRPMDRGNFAIKVRVQLAADAICRLRVGDSVIELSRDQVVVDGDARAVTPAAQSPSWTLLGLHRHDGSLTVKVNGQEHFTFTESTADIAAVSLAAQRGTVGVSHFHLIGELERRPVDDAGE